MENNSCGGIIIQLEKTQMYNIYIQLMSLKLSFIYFENQSAAKL